MSIVQRHNSNCLESLVASLEHCDKALFPLADAQVELQRAEDKERRDGNSIFTGLRLVLRL